MHSKEEIKTKLRNNGDGEEFYFDGDIASIDAHAIGEYRVEIGHFVVKRDEREQGYGSRVFESLLSVLRDEGYTSAVVKIQAVDDGGKNDPVMCFLRKYDFKYHDTFESPNWGTCIKAFGTI